MDRTGDSASPHGRQVFLLTVIIPVLLALGGCFGDAQQQSADCAQIKGAQQQVQQDLQAAIDPSASGSGNLQELTENLRMAAGELRTAADKTANQELRSAANEAAADLEGFETNPSVGGAARLAETVKRVCG